MQSTCPSQLICKMLNFGKKNPYWLDLEYMYYITDFRNDYSRVRLPDNAKKGKITLLYAINGIYSAADPGFPVRGAPTS